MKTLQKLSLGIASLSLLCLVAANASASTTVHLACTASGSWNSAGTHISTSGYRIGYSLAFPKNQVSYFVYNLSPLQGKTITVMNLLIKGSTDYHITDVWTSHPAGQTANQFKVGIAPQCNTAYPITLSQILTGPTSTTLYTDANDANRNPDAGYGWVQDGLHTGQTFDAWHYATPKARVQTEINTGGSWAFWACDRFDGSAGNENYIWGSTAFSSANTLNATY